MSEINVLSRTQHIIVDPASGSVAVISAGPIGPTGLTGDTGEGGANSFAIKTWDSGSNAYIWPDGDPGADTYLWIRFIDVSGGGHNPATTTGGRDVFGDVWENTANGITVAGPTGPTGPIREEPYQNHGNAGSTETLDVDTARVHRLVLDQASCALTFTGADNDGQSYAFTMYAVQDGTGGRLITFASTIKWAGGVLPVLSTAPNAIDVFTFETYDGGTVWYGFMAGKGMA